MKNEEIAGIEQGRSDPMRLGFNQLQRILAPVPQRRRPLRADPRRTDRAPQEDFASTRSLRSIATTSGPITASSWSSATSSLPRSCRSWPRRSRAGRPTSPTPGSNGRSSRTSSRERETIATPDKENAVYLAGLSMPIKDDDPDYPALLAGNFILGGGGLSSRLADRLRQKGGLSYTAMSMFQASPLDAQGRSADPGDL